MIVFQNGRLISDKKASVSIYDHGFLYGDGVYETIRVYNGRPFLLQDHLKRLGHSLKGIRLEVPMSLMEIGVAVLGTVQANHHKEAVARVIITRGAGPYGFDPRPCKEPNIVITSEPFKPYPAEFHANGIVAAVVNTRRNSPQSLPPSVKSTSCLNSILARMEANDLGAQEGIFLTQENYVAEGTVSNVFMAKGGVLITPRLEGSLLPGVTRHWVCALAQKAEIPLEEKRISASELASAAEIFITNTTFEVLPVTSLVVPEKLNQAPLRLGPELRKPGPLTRRLMQMFKRSVMMG